MLLVTAHCLYTFHGAQFLDERSEALRVVDQHGEHPREEPVVGVDIDASQHDVFFLGYDGSNVVDDTQIVLPHHVKRNGIGT